VWVSIIGIALTGLGIFLLYVWFGTRRTMVERGTWETEVGDGAYVWFVIYLVLIVVGVAMALAS
jgi:hypothetical protein